VLNLLEDFVLRLPWFAALDIKLAVSASVTQRGLYAMKIHRHTDFLTKKHS